MKRRGCLGLNSGFVRRNLTRHVSPFGATSPSIGTFSARGACSGVVGHCRCKKVDAPKICVSRAIVHVYCAREHLFTGLTLRLVRRNGGSGTLGILQHYRRRLPRCGVPLSCVDNNGSVTGTCTLIKRVSETERISRTI